MLIQANKLVDKTIATIGDIITYTIRLVNTGTVAANNLVISDPIPCGTIYVANSVGANVPITGDPTTTIQLVNPLQPSSEAIISFKVRITMGAITSTSECPGENPIMNKASATYVFTPVPGQGSIRETVTTNNVSTQVNYADLSPVIKLVDQNLAYVGEKLTYSLAFKNNGNIQAENVIIKDLLPNGVSYVENSLSANVTITGSPLTEMRLSNAVQPGQNVSVQFQVLLTNNLAGNIVVNQADVYYQYTVVTGGIPVQEIEPSNPVATEVRKLEPVMSLVKSANRVGVIVGDIIQYTIKVQNTGNLDAINVLVKDVLAPGLLYANQLLINDVPSVGDITAGIVLATVAQGTTTVIKFNAKVENIPPTGSIFVNQAIGSYEYQIRPQGPILKGDMQSNKVMVTGYNTAANITKMTKDGIVEKGKLFDYTAVIKNNGQLDAENIWIQDSMPTQFKVEQVSVNGTPVNGKLDVGLYIGPLAKGKETTIKIQVKVMDTIIAPFKNVINATLLYKIDPNFPPSENKIQAEAPAVWVINPELTLSKKADRKEYAIDERVEYTVKVTNTGTQDVVNVTVYDVLPPELEFVTGSLKVDGIPMAMESILLGVQIPEIKVGKSVSITFDADTLKQGIISNQATADYLYRETPNSTQQVGSNKSNIEQIRVSNVTIEVNKQADKDFVSLDEIINYTVKLRNATQVMMVNILFKDKLPNNTVLLPNSFRIDGKLVNSVDLQDGINIGNLSQGADTIITYSVKVVSGVCSGTIINGAWVSYDYILPDGTIGHKTLEPNGAAISMVDMGISNFKQMSIESYLPIPITKPDIEGINAVTGTIDIKECHVIQTPTNHSLENQRLTGYKLIVNGVLNLVIEYTALEETQSVHSAHYSIPFSTFIVLPSDYKLGSKMDINGVVEDIYYNVIDIRNFFQNTTALINAKILYCD